MRYLLLIVVIGLLSLGFVRPQCAVSANEGQAARPCNYAQPLPAPLVTVSVVDMLAVTLVALRLPPGVAVSLPAWQPGPAPALALAPQLPPPRPA